MLVEEKILFNEIKNRNRDVYEALFCNYYSKLVRFAEGYLFDKHASEDIVQDLFIHFWENAEKITLDISLKSYFFQSVKNSCLNHIRDLKIHDRHNLLYLQALLNQENYEEVYDPEIIFQISTAIAQLPIQMAEIFKLKFLNDKKIMEIAQMKHISKNTVKTQLQRAKEKIRKTLIESTLLRLLF